MKKTRPEAFDPKFLRPVVYCECAEKSEDCLSCANGQHDSHCAFPDYQKQEESVQKETNLPKSTQEEKGLQYHLHEELREVIQRKRQHIDSIQFTDEIRDICMKYIDKALKKQREESYEKGYQDASNLYRKERDILLKGKLEKE